MSLGGRLTSPVIAEGLAIVTSVDAHTVDALDAQRGTPVWQYTCGGRIDSPPTVARGLVVFGSVDGFVYCLDARDGRLAWRFRAAPQERRIVALDQIESSWPVSGSVLVEGDVVYCAAGRTSYLDGGIFLHRLDLRSGRPLSEVCLNSRDPKTGDQPAEPMMFDMPGALPDVLSFDGRNVYMRHLAFSPADLAPCKSAPHLYNPAGFLDGDWWHRTYFLFGEHFYSGYIGWYFMGREVPAGRLLTISGSSVYGFSYKPEFYNTASTERYQLVALDLNRQPAPGPIDYARANREFGGPARRGNFKVKYRWESDVPLLARAMVLAGDTLFLAGPSQRALRSPADFSGRNGGVLSIVSTRDGKPISNYRLASPPVYDGMAAAGKRLYVSAEDGRLLCLGGAATAPDAKELPALTEARRSASGQPREPGLVGH